MKTMRVLPENSNSFYGMIKPLIFGTIFGILISLILLMLTAAYMAANDLSDTSFMIIVYVITSISALFAGISAARKYKCRGMMIGALTGAVFFVIIFLISLILPNPTQPGMTGFMKLVLSVLCGTFGGIFGVNMKRK